MTSFDVAAMVQELFSRLKGVRVSNIYQTNSSLLLFKLHRRGEGTLWLLIEPGRRMHLTSFTVEKPGSPPQFCRNLRKILRNATLDSITQIEFERIVELTFRSKTGECRLVIEVFGKGNAVLVGSSGEILHALHFRRMRDRHIVRGEPFSMPPSSGANPWVESSASLGLLHDFGELEVVRGLTRALSIGGLYAEELLLRSSVDKSTPCSDLSREQLSRLQGALEVLRKSVFIDGLSPEVVLDSEGEWVDVVPIRLERYKSFEKLAFNSFNEACDEYFTRRASRERMLEESEDQKPVNEQLRILSFQTQRLEQRIREAEKLKAVGDLIYRHYSELSDIHQHVQADLKLGKDPKEISEELVKSKPGISGETQINFGKTKSLQLELEGTKISLNLADSVRENADRYYSKAKESRRKLPGLRKAIQATQSKIEAMNQSIRTQRRKPTPIRKRRRLQWFERFRWFRSSDDFLVLGGRDASTNEILVKKHMVTSDLVVHAELPGAPFVLVRTEGREVPDKTLREACQFAVSTSRAWRLGLGSADAFWVKSDQISSSPPPGQYMEKGMFMVYGPRNYVRGIPVRFAVGLIEEENHLMLIGGPPSAVGSQTEHFVEIVPGGLSSLKLTEEIKASLVKGVSSQQISQIESIPADDFQRLLPPGKGRLSGAKK